MSGKAPRQKGDRVEREIVHRLNAIPGVEAERVPLSGAAGGSFSGDLLVKIPTADLLVEVKARKKSQWKQLEKWLGSNHALVLREDAKEPLVLLPWEVFADMVRDITRSYSHGRTTETPARGASKAARSPSEEE